MKKKLFALIVISLFVVSGCQANYTISYEDGVFNENLELINSKSEYIEDDEGHASFESFRDGKVIASIDGQERYAMDPNSTKYDMILNHRLENTTLDDMISINECFSDHTYSDENGQIYFSAYGDFLCSYLKDSTVTLKTDSEVLYTNAHETKDGLYIWNLDKKSLGNEGIVFQLMQKKESDSVSKEIIPWYVKIIIILTVIVIFVFGFTLIKNKRG